jgi:transcriptional regulator with XRE-family HTH domain
MALKFSHRELPIKRNVLYQRNDVGRRLRQHSLMGNEFGRNLREARKAKGWSQERLAQEAEMESKGYISALEAGKRPIPPGNTLAGLASALGVQPADLLRDPTDPRRPGRTVPLVGYVGAGAQAHYYASADEGLGEVDAPEDATETTVAAEIRGVSLGPALDRWLVFYDEVRSPVTPDMHGRLCVVGLDDERVLVKVIRPAGEPGRFHLISNGSEEPIFDQAVMWAAKVTGMKPR